MLCQNCQKNAATVHVTELLETDTDEPEVREEQLCEICAQSKDLPHAPVGKKSVTDILKLLQFSAQQGGVRRKPAPSCPNCGMTWEEFRKRGRFGCPEDYEVFKKPLQDLLQRMHGSLEHVGRVPGVSPEQVARKQLISDLGRKLDSAVRDEDYEEAARIRDELKSLSAEAQGSS